MGIGKLVTTQENLKLKNFHIYKWDTYFSYMQICVIGTVAQLMAHLVHLGLQMKNLKS